MALILPITKYNYVRNMNSLLSDEIVSIDDILYWQWNWKYDSTGYIEWLNQILNGRSPNDFWKNANDNDEFGGNKEKPVAKREKTNLEKLFSKGNNPENGIKFTTSDDQSWFGGWEYEVSFNDLKKHSSWIKTLSNFLGKTEGKDKEVKHNKIIREETNSLSVFDNEIFKLHPDQFALLDDPELEDIFLLGFSERRLFQSGYKRKIINKPKVAKVDNGRGPLIICLDTSFSMFDIPVPSKKLKKEMAKSNEYDLSPLLIGKLLMFELATHLAKNKRKVIINEFNDDVETFIFESIDKQYDDFLKYWKSISTGGTDADYVLKTSLDMVETENIENADILVISDMAFGENNHQLIESSIKAHKKGVRIFGIDALIKSREPKNWVGGRVFDKTFTITRGSDNDINETMNKKINSFFKGNAKNKK